MKKETIAILDKLPSSCIALDNKKKVVYFNKFAKNTRRQSHGRHQNARDQYAKKTKVQHATTRSYFNKKKRW